MQRFRKKPVVIEAVQFDGSIQSAGHICKWVNRDLQGDEDRICDFVTYNDDKTAHDFQVHTLEGHMQIDVGDWIIKGVKGEYYPCKPDIFELTYDLVEE